MTQTKYITSGGLAFSEDKDMEKLRQFSLEGWHVKNFKFMGYVLEEGERADYIYSVDYRKLKDDEKEEYFDVFSYAGWSHVTSEGNIHLFRAHPGTRPIYSDRETSVEKYGNLIGSMKRLAIPLILTTALAWFGATISAGILQSFLQIIAIILTVIAIPTACTIMATYNNKWKAKGKNGFVHLVKVITILFFLVTIIISLVIDGGTIYILVSMVIGAIALPTAIWGIMALYQKVAKKQA